MPNEHYRSRRSKHWSSPAGDMRSIPEPTYEQVTEEQLHGILVDGVSGKQPAMQARWYLLRGYQVYDARSKVPIILKAERYSPHLQQSLEYNLYRVTYPKDYKLRTREPDLRSNPFSLGRWKDVYQDQINKVDYVAGQNRQAGDKVTTRKWPLHVGAKTTDITKPLRIETAPVEKLEPVELACRDYLANLPAASLAAKTQKARKGKGVETMNDQRRDDLLLKLIDRSEGRRKIGMERKASASVDPAKMRELKALDLV